MCFPFPLTSRRGKTTEVSGNDFSQTELCRSFGITPGIVAQTNPGDCPGRSVVFWVPPRSRVGGGFHICNTNAVWRAPGLRKRKKLYFSRPAKVLWGKPNPFLLVLRGKD